MEILVTDAMVDAAIARLNFLGAADAAHETVLMSWGDIVKEVYLAMEAQRRQDVDDAIAHNPVASEMMRTMQRRYSNVASATALRQKFNRRV